MPYARVNKAVRVPLNGVITDLPAGKILDGDNATLVLSDASLDVTEVDDKGQPIDGTEAPKRGRAKPSED